MSGIRVKKKDEKKRKRNININFRVTPEEKRLLDDRIELSGLMKREFFIQSCLHQKINTFGNVKTFDVIRKKLCVVEKHLSEIEKSEELDLEVLESLRTILEMFDGLDRSGIDEKDDI